ncbi:uncharacterized protein LOC122534935 isoform X3 [Frieseomelitta varia]|uniref:uncharacterized protein LOC122534935 isoform X3 n=1 Tax=Frieseomelitta varia TaxID=561572 RepID=UPI001CB68401|nr:uncharacterized protein LOC122534935 isoform X3 [Frieseomelitta varia]
MARLCQVRVLAGQRGGDISKSSLTRILYRTISDRRQKRSRRRIAEGRDEEGRQK